MDERNRTYAILKLKPCDWSDDGLYWEMLTPIGTSLYAHVNIERVWRIFNRITFESRFVIKLGPNCSEWKVFVRDFAQAEAKCANLINWSASQVMTSVEKAKEALSKFGCEYVTTSSMHQDYSMHQRFVWRVVPDQEYDTIWQGFMADRALVHKNK